ncbi:hypothetical protein AB833_25980 [Chromatiales bacterium (ex Bugula neritina AB1)]|nr:hypothetical protein AB833_25980 [Chromatiales bacterium (ex Bugula neritina AB1)]
MVSLAKNIGAALNGGVMSMEKLRNEIVATLPAIDSDRIDPALFQTTGIAIVRGGVPKDQMEYWTNLWDRYRENSIGSERKLENASNPVEVRHLPPELLNISHSPYLINHIKPVFGENIGLFHKRFVVKDANAKGAVILHQDSGYHVGLLEKASLFLALKPVSEANGGMYLYPGTHRFGYLGDAGAINARVLPADWPVITPSLEPGDFMLMNSLTWHGSGPFHSGDERVMTDFIYQPSTDPSTAEVVSGGQGWEGSFLTQAREKIFLQSRSSKLHAIRGILDSTTN